MRISDCGLRIFWGGDWQKVRGQKEGFLGALRGVVRGTFFGEGKGLDWWGWVG